MEINCWNKDEMVYTLIWSRRKEDDIECRIKDHITSTEIVLVHLQYNLMMITLLKNLLYLHFFFFLLHFRFLWYSISILYWNKFALSMMYTADVSFSNIVKLLQSENSSYVRIFIRIISYIFPLFKKDRIGK